MSKRYGTDFTNRLNDALGAPSVTIGGRPATDADRCFHGRLVCSTCTIAIVAPEWGANTEGA